MSATTAGCPFCQMVMEYIATGEGIEQIGASGVYHFEPLNPVTPGHRLFIPAFHYEDAAEAPSATGAVFEWAAWWAAKQGGDFNLIVNCGPAATQTVRHLHVHYVPRRPGDGLILPWSHQHAGEAHTTTDDERPTIELARFIASWDQGIEATNRIPHWAANLAMHLRELGFRRPVQGEPLPDYFAPKPMPQGWVWAKPTEVDADPDTAFELGRVAGYDEAMREVQAEPTNAMLLAALNARDGVIRDLAGVPRVRPAETLLAFGEESILEMRAALRAALKEGENR